MTTNYLLLIQQKIWISHKPSLFQHIGTHSSLRGKIQKLKDKGFGRVKLFVPHANPIAKSTYTSLKEYKNYRLNNAYNGRNYFWGFSPVKDDHITFQFDSPVHLKRQMLWCFYFSLFNDYFITIQVSDSKWQPWASQWYYTECNFAS